MKAVNIEIKLFQFNELLEEAKRKAIEEHRNFLLSIMLKEDFISGDPEYDTEDELEKTYNAEYDYVLFNDEPVIESIECNEYYFFYDGELANTVTYIGNHEKAGVTEFIYNGIVYKVA